jgi:hypothetical protein
MISLSLNDFFNDQYLWTDRILGNSDFSKKRDISQIEREYNLDKYKSLFDLDLPDMEAYKVMEFEHSGIKQDQEVRMSFKDELFKMPLKRARLIAYNIFKDMINPYLSENNCELGCGYGFNLELIKGNNYGGEYSQYAVDLGKKLGHDLVQFNYYNESDYDFIKPGSTVFTVHSIEQMPDAKVIIDSLYKQKDKIKYVVHFDPSYLQHRTNFIGKARNKYIELNDYNRNLFSYINSRTDIIEVLALEYDVISMQINPLNSTNFIAYKFK